MPAQSGAAFLLKIADGASPPAYQTIAGLRTTQMSINGDTVVVTRADDRQVTYEVVARERFDKDRVPLRELFSRSFGHEPDSARFGEPALDRLVGKKEPDGEQRAGCSRGAHEVEPLLDRDRDGQADP